MRRLFDVGWMRIFVETVRLGSLSSAAASLGLTQPAVSYQIRRIEEQTGFAVLHRRRQGVELTAGGRKLFEIAERAVADIDALMREQTAAAARPTLRLRTDYAFSSLWLLPRMHQFRLLHPEIDIQIVATQRHQPDEMLDGDVAIVFGDRAEAGASASLMLLEEVVPVCTQAYLERNGPFTKLSALAKARLIHLDGATPSPWFDWNRYFGELGSTRDLIANQGDLSFNTYSLVTQAAIEDQGVALGWMGLVDGYLRSRVLVPAGPAVQAPHRGYWLVPPQTASVHSDRLVAWLTAETATNTPPS